MRSKLVFESNTGDSLHQWGKYSVGTDYHYEWAKHKLYDEYKYFWNKHDILTTGKLTTYWDKYSVIENPAYAIFSKEKLELNKEYLWKYYTYSPAGTRTYSWDKHLAKYVWNYYNIKETPIYETKYALPTTMETKNSPIAISGYDGSNYQLDLATTYNKNDFVKWGTFDMSKVKITSNGITQTLKYANIYDVLDSIVLCGATGVSIDRDTGQATYQGIEPPTTNEDGSYIARPENYYITRASESCVNPDGSVYGDMVYEVGQSRIVYFPIGTKFFSIFEGYYPPGLKQYTEYLEDYPYVTLQFTTKAYDNRTATTKGFNLNERVVQLPTTLKTSSYFSEYWYYGLILCFEKTGEDMLDIYVSNCRTGSLVQSQIQVGTTQEKGTLVGTVKSATNTAYPTDGISGNYWYTYSGVEPGDFVEIVYSTDFNYKPANELDEDGYFYLNKLYTTSTQDVIGDYVGEVQHSYSGQYPSNGIQGDYWYVYDGTVNVTTYFGTPYWRS